MVRWWRWGWGAGWRPAPDQLKALLEARELRVASKDHGAGLAQIQRGRRRIRSEKPGNLLPNIVTPPDALAKEEQVHGAAFNLRRVAGWTSAEARRATVRHRRWPRRNGAAPRRRRRILARITPWNGVEPAGEQRSPVVAGQ